MDVISRGSKTVIQSYNPMCIGIIERKTGGQTVQRFYASTSEMRAADKLAYYRSAKKLNSLRRSR